MFSQRRKNNMFHFIHKYRHEIGSWPNPWHAIMVILKQMLCSVWLAPILQVEISRKPSFLTKQITQNSKTESSAKNQSAKCLSDHPFIHLPSFQLVFYISIHRCSFASFYTPHFHTTLHKNLRRKYNTLWYLGISWKIFDFFIISQEILEIVIRSI